ncbi:MAG: hypothetical protein ACRDAU_10235 [Clostridium sp.]
MGEALRLKNYALRGSLSMAFVMDYAKMKLDINIINSKIYNYYKFVLK